MQLEAYLKLRGISEAEFAALVGASEHGVRKWVRRDRVPRADAMRKIIEVTAGAVTAADFFELPRAAQPQSPAQASGESEPPKERAA